MRIDPFQFSSVLLYSSSGWSAIFASLPGTGKASTYRLSSSRHSSVLTVAVTTDVPPVAVWSMAAIGWGLRGGISRQIRFCCLVEWKFY